MGELPVAKCLEPDSYNLPTSDNIHMYITFAEIPKAEITGKVGNKDTVSRALQGKLTQSLYIYSHP